MIIGHLKCQQAHGELSSVVFGRTLGVLGDSAIGGSNYINIFPHRSGGARLCLGSAIAKLSHECPTLRQSED